MMQRLEVARQQVINGAQIIDVNMDEGMLESLPAMVKFLQLSRQRAGYFPGAHYGRLFEMGRD